MTRTTMSDALKSKRVRVCDNGLFLPLAMRLSRDFGEVEYFKPWVSQAPTSMSLLVGEGFDEVTRIKSLWDNMDSVDLWVFPDILFGDIQSHLVKLGHRV